MKLIQAWPDVAMICPEKKDKDDFWLEEDVSCAICRDSLTPKGQAKHLG